MSPDADDLHAVLGRQPAREVQRRADRAAHAVGVGHDEAHRGGVRARARAWVGQGRDECEGDPVGQDGGPDEQTPAPGHAAGRRGDAGGLLLGGRGRHRRKGCSVTPVPRVTVVVPVYGVEEYIEAALRSIAAQTMDDLEVVVVDDGSTDASAEIAARIADEDPRFRILRQDNAGLGAARNAGLRAGDSELVAFVDGDDMLTPGALELLSSSLDRSGSDFATGMVHRLRGDASRPAPFLKKAFVRSRRRTHVTRFEWLVSDRVAWNKLWRRDFLDRHDLRFTEGAFHEDIPMVVPAHYLARAVDVVARPVYLYREREGESQSITQRRLELRVLRDRVAAVRSVCDFLDDRGFPPRAYHESVLAEDLRYHLDVLDAADDEYRRVFLDDANAFLHRAGEGIEDGLPAIQRLKWHLVRRRLVPELLKVLRFERDGFRARPTVRIGGRRYGDYPFLEDRGLGVPRAVYRIDTGRRRARQAGTLLRAMRPVPRGP